MTSQQRSPLSARTLWAGLSTVLVLGLVAITTAISFAALIFVGPLAPYLPMGIGMALFATVALSVVAARGSSLGATLAVPQGETAALAAVIASVVWFRLGSHSPPETVFTTLVVAIGGGTVLTGVLMAGLGWLRLGDFVRYVPYPVIGGFGAGVAWLLVRRAFVVLSGVPLQWAQLAHLLQPLVLVRWLPGLLLALLLLVLLKQTFRPGVVLAVLVGGGALFYGALALSGTTIPAAMAEGWLLGPMPRAGWGQGLAILRAGEVVWPVLWGQAGTYATMFVVTVLSLLLAASALELAAQEDLDFNRELRALGTANVLSGLGGGLAGFHAVGLSTLNLRSGLPARWGGTLVAGLSVLMLWLGAWPLAYIPRMVLGGLLLYLGLRSLWRWLFVTWGQMPWAEYVLLWLIPIVIATLGLLPGVAVGTLIAVLLFAVTYSRVPVVKYTLSGSTFRSNVDRSPADADCLAQEGGVVSIFKLQGMIFFGSAYRLLAQVRQRLAAETPLRYLILDFAAVHGVDSSALMSFQRLQQLAKRQDFRLIFCQVRIELAQQLGWEGQAAPADANLLVFPDLDRALEWCEDRLLARAAAVGRRPAPGLWEQLAMTFDAPALQVFRSYLERLTLEPQQVFIHKDAPTDALYLVESGQVTVVIPRADGSHLRLRTMGPGAVVGEIALFLQSPRSASVLADSPTVVYRLSSAAIRRLESEQPAAAFAFYQFMARLLADRLQKTDRMLQAMLD